MCKKCPFCGHYGRPIIIHMAIGTLYKCERCYSTLPGHDSEEEKDLGLANFRPFRDFTTEIWRILELETV